eukprot:210226_1
MVFSNGIGWLLDSTDIHSYLLSYLTTKEICIFARVCSDSARLRDTALAKVRHVKTRGARDVSMRWYIYRAGFPKRLVQTGMLANVRVFDIGDINDLSSEIDILLYCPLVERISSFKINSLKMWDLRRSLGTRVFPSLTHIRLSNASPETLTFLAKFPNLKSIEFARTYASFWAETQSVLAFLDANPQLTDIQEFHHICVRLADAVEIIDHILTMPNLQRLSISINQGIILERNRYPNAKCAPTLRSVTFFRQHDLKNYMWPAYPNLTEFECSRFCFDSLSCSPECSSYDGCMSAECGHNNWWDHLRILRLTDNHDMQDVHGMALFSFPCLTELDWKVMHKDFKSADAMSAYTSLAKRMPQLTTLRMRAPFHAISAFVGLDSHQIDSPTRLPKLKHLHIVALSHPTKSESQRFANRLPSIHTLKVSNESKLELENNFEPPLGSRAEFECSDYELEQGMDAPDLFSLPLLNLRKLSLSGIGEMSEPMWESLLAHHMPKLWKLSVSLEINLDDGIFQDSSEVISRLIRATPNVEVVDMKHPSLGTRRWYHVLKNPIVWPRLHDRDKYLVQIEEDCNIPPDIPYDEDRQRSCRCSNCKKVKYCTRQCQNADCKLLHRSFCRAFVPS